MSKTLYSRIAAAPLLLALVSCVAAPAAASAGGVLISRGVQPALVSDLGPAPPQARVHFAIVLRYRDVATLDRLIAAQGNSASPLYRHFLTAQRFRAEFAPSDQASERVSATLRREGFRIDALSSNRTVLDVSAPVAVANRYFATDVHLVRAKGGLHLANMRSAYLPAELQRDVLSVDGLNDVPWFAPALHGGAKLPSGQVVIHGRMRGPAPWHSYGPRAFADGYDLPVQHAVPGGSGGVTYDGTGRVAGLIATTDPLDSDLAAWLTYFGIVRTGTTTRIAVDGGPENDDGFLSATVDYETTVGLAPGANVDLYELPDLSIAHVIDLFNRIVSDDQADAIDTPFGACETISGIDPPAIAQILKQGTAQGQTFDAPMSTDGPFTPNCGGISIEAPADTPYSVAIGGTELNVRNDGKYFDEYYWDVGGFLGAGGGGVSVIFPLPAYQKNVPGIVASGRNVPDLSFDADVDTGEAIYIDGAWFDTGPIGGTELGTGIFAACALEADQVAGARLPSMTGTLYKNWLTRGYGHGATVRAHDVISGVPWPPLVPRAGYDLATGIGSLDCFNAATTLL